VAVLVAATGATAYGLFRLLAEKWLDSRFGERLEALRHAQQQELEQLRARISALWITRQNCINASTTLYRYCGRN